MRLRINQEPNRTRHKIHVAMRDLLPSFIITTVLFLGIVAVFFRMGWHVPDDLQPIMVLVLYLGLLFPIMYLMLNKFGIYVVN